MTFEKTWQPNDQDVETLEEQIKNERVSGGLVDDSNFIKNCAKIGAFLMDEEAVLKQLIELNRKVSEELNKKNLNISDKGAVKVLRSFLEKELAEAGFATGFCQTKGSKGLSNKDFQWILSHGFLFKDSTLRGLTHGEFTHALQWVLIVWQQKATGFLLGATEKEANISDIYKTLGSPDARNMRSIWSLIVDEAQDESVKSRSPEWLSDYIHKNKESLEVLQQLLEKRFKKGQEEGIGHLEGKELRTDRYEVNQERPNILVPKSK
ncbi:LirA/MavJ family T4SS effector [Legionella sainthelensi]|uniref:DUF5636 domain-containing protein n=1 Tax=Legionella sainthelensi TaxID=28087 RepID=A0A2H5FPJ1_9GAMM|nr:LirA/MavJ family T4SS effector [Legionella sainthelensi]AUH73410.1 hypothetical protein CAB17_16125 [Legionella sainthelensi]